MLVINYLTDREQSTPHCPTPTFSVHTFLTTSALPWPPTCGDVHLDDPVAVELDVKVDVREQAVLVLLPYALYLPDEAPDRQVIVEHLKGEKAQPGWACERQYQGLAGWITCDEYWPAAL